MSWGKYVDQHVRIEWRDSAETWNYFAVLHVVDTTHRIARLRGIDAPDGSKYRGGDFNAGFDEIKKITRISE